MAFGAATTVALLAAFALFYVLLDKQLTQAQERGLEVRANYLAAAVKAGNLQAVQRDPLAQLYGPAGEVLAESTSLSGRRLLGVAEAVRAERRGSTRPVNLESSGDAPVRLRSQPLGPGLGLLTVGVSAEPVERGHDRLVKLVLIAGPLLVAVVLLAGWAAVRAALAPVDRLRREAEAISSVDTQVRLSPVPGEDELARLARTLDAMLDRLHVAFDRERAFVDDASHELRTPIAVMRGELELAHSALAEGDLTELERALRAAGQENERLARLAEDLLLLARERAGTLVVRREPVDLLDLCWAEGLRLGGLLGIAVTVDGDPAVVDGDPDRLRQVLANLLQNSAQAGARSVLIRLGETDDGVEMVVADDGPGFAPHLTATAFDRFVRADGARTRDIGGAGLGLAIVRAVVSAHEGRVEAANGPPLAGGRVTVRLRAG
ncbi:MAG: sensor histidine kinase [Sporichthyaceae bacterium]